MPARVIPVNIALPARCDQCGSQAWVELEMQSGARLAFCAHHFAEHEDLLVDQARTIVDHRPLLNTQEQGVAPVGATL